MRTPYPNELMHYGIMGMKWGVRRYQNPDGTLTAAGKKRYETTNADKVRSARNKMQSAKVDLAAARQNYKNKDSNYHESYKSMENAVTNWVGKEYKRDNFSKAIDETNAAAKERKKAKSAYKSALKEYRAELKKTNEGLANSKKNFADKYIFNSATEKYANNLLNRHPGMTVDQAKNSAYVTAGLNTVAILGGIALYELYKH